MGIFNHVLGGIRKAFVRKAAGVPFNWSVVPPTDEEVEAAKARADRKRKRARAHALSAKLAELGVLAAAFLTCEMVYKGLNLDLARDLGLSLQNSLMALSVAVTLSLCIYIGFLKATKLSTTMDRASAYIGGWVCIFFFCCWAVGTSSWYAFMSTTGTPALHLKLIDSTAMLDAAVTKATAQIKNARGMPTAMAAKAAGFGTRGASEAAGGGATGAKGSGPVSQSLEGAAAVLTTGAAGISAAIEKADADAVKLRARVAELSQLVMDRSLPIFERETAYLKGASEVRAMVSAMNAAGLGEIVSSTLAAVKSAVSVMPTDSSKVGVRQAEAIGQTRSDMEKIAADLERVLGDLKGAEAETGSLVETMSLSQVVWNYKHNFKPALALAIGIDLFAVWALIFLGLHGLEEVRKRQELVAYTSLIELDEDLGGELVNPDAIKAGPVSEDSDLVVAAGKKKRRA